MIDLKASLELAGERWWVSFCRDRKEDSEELNPIDYMLHMKSSLYSVSQESSHDVKGQAHSPKSSSYAFVSAL